MLDGVELLNKVDLFTSLTANVIAFVVGIPAGLAINRWIEKRKLLADSRDALKFLLVEVDDNIERCRLGQEQIEEDVPPSTITLGSPALSYITRDPRLVSALNKGLRRDVLDYENALRRVGVLDNTLLSILTSGALTMPGSKTYSAVLSALAHALSDLSEKAVNLRRQLDHLP